MKILTAFLFGVLLCIQCQQKIPDIIYIETVLLHG